MAELSDYGEIAILYEGEGMLLFEDAEAVPCTFQAAQYHQGSLYLKCENLDIKNSFELEAGSRVNEFQGITTDNVAFQIKGEIIVILIRGVMAEVVLVAVGNTRFNYGTPLDNPKKVIFTVVNYLLIDYQEFQFEGRLITITRKQDYLSKRKGSKKSRSPTNHMLIRSRDW